MGTAVTYGAAPISLADAKAHLRVLHDEDDASISALIEAAVDDIESRTGRLFRSSTVVHTRNGFPDGPLVLPRPPVTAVSSVAYIDTAGDAQTFADFVADLSAIPGTIQPAPGSAWPSTQDRSESVTVTYTAGHSAVPSVARFACLLWLDMEYHDTRPDRAKRIDRRISDLVARLKVRDADLKGVGT